MVDSSENIRSTIKQKLQKIDDSALGEIDNFLDMFLSQNKKQSNLNLENCFPDLLPEGVELDQALTKNRSELEIENLEKINKWNI